MTHWLPSHLTGDVHEHASGQGRHLLDRLQPLTDWSNERLRQDAESYSKVTSGLIRPRLRGTDRAGRSLSGVNLAHACLMEGATAATPHVHRFAHLSAKGLETRLARVRREHPDAGILVVTESLFSMDSDTPDLQHAVDVCRAHGATLMVDCAHDLGCLGSEGLGHLAAQGVLGEVDIVMGSFSKTFASNGGFVASSHPALKLALRYTCGPQTFTNAMSPIQAAVVLKALEIVRSQPT